MAGQMKLKTRKICPQCRSIYIGLWMGTDLGIKYQCNECKYIGNVVIEEPLDNELKQKERAIDKRVERRRNFKKQKGRKSSEKS